MEGLIIEGGETTLKFSVDGIGSNNTNDYSDLDYWLNITVCIESRNFDYFYSGETLEYGELIQIREYFKILLAERLLDQTDVLFTEPDFEFILYPSVKPSDLGKPLGIWRLDEDICVDFVINLTDSDGSYNGSRFVIPFDRDMITAWVEYLDEAIDEFDAEKKQQIDGSATTNELVSKQISITTEKKTGSTKSRFPSVRWFCDECDAFLNRQQGFDDHLNSWICKKCGYENIIAPDNVFESKADYRVHTNLFHAGIYDGILMTPFGIVFLLFDGYPIASRAIELERDAHCPDVNGRYKIVFDYLSDNDSHSLSCIIEADDMSGIKSERESGESLEALSFSINDFKMTIGAYGEESSYVNGTSCQDHDFDYDILYHGNGLAYEILPTTKSNTFIFGISWILSSAKENSSQTWYAADPGAMK